MQNGNNSLFVNQDWNQSLPRLNALRATPGYGSPALQGTNRADWDQFSGMPKTNWGDALSNAQPYAQPYANGKQWDQFSGLPGVNSGGKRRSRKIRRTRRSKKTTRSRKSRRHRK